MLWSAWPTRSMSVTRRVSCVVATLTCPMAHGHTYAHLTDGKFMSAGEVQPAVSASWLSPWRWHALQVDSIIYEYLPAGGSSVNRTPHVHLNTEKRLPHRSMAPLQDGKPSKN